MSGLRFGLSLSMQGRGGEAWKPSDIFLPGDNGFLYDFSLADTLFQEATGITPAGVDQNVGLALDVSKWGGKTLAQVLAGQAELVANGGFESGTTGWSSVSSASLSVVTGRLRVTNSGAGFGRASQAIACVVGRRYQVAGDFAYSATNGGIRIGTTAGGAETLLPSAFTSSRSFSASFVATATTHYVTLITDTATTTGVYTDYDNISVKEIPGNHASQATSSARPVLKAGGLTRYDGSDDNLLTTLVPGTAMTLALKFVCSTQARAALGSSTVAPRSYIGLANLGPGRLGGGVGGQNWDVVLGSSGDDRNNLITGVLTASTADGVRLYRDGVQVYAAAMSGSLAGSLPYRLGAASNGGSATAFLFGDIYQALAINRALTPAEIVKLTNAWSY